MLQARLRGPPQATEVALLRCQAAVGAVRWKGEGQKAYCQISVCSWLFFSCLRVRAEGACTCLQNAAWTYLWFEKPAKPTWQTLQRSKQQIKELASIEGFPVV